MNARDRLTALTTRGPLATKRVTRAPDGQWQIEPYGNARHFAARQIEVSDIISLGRALDQLQHDSRSFVIRGKPLPGTDPSRCRRLLHPEIDDDGEEHPATFGAAARRWLALDFDALPTPAWCPADLARRREAIARDQAEHGYQLTAADLDPEPIDAVLDWALVVRAAVATLPAEFRDASAWWQVTSSAGIKPGVRLRLWYWCDRPVSDGEVKRWLAGRPVDRALYSPVQAHYVARPTFDPPSLDPVPLRAGMWWRHVNVVPVPALPEPPPPEPVIIKQLTPHRQDALARRATAYADACIRNVATAPTGNRHAAMRHAALTLYGMAEHGLLEAGDVTRQLLAIANGLRWPAKRINGLLDWCRAVATAKPELPEGFGP